jgi:hypothetical protein
MATGVNRNDVGVFQTGGDQGFLAEAVLQLHKPGRVVCKLFPESWLHALDSHDSFQRCLSRFPDFSNPAGTDHGKKWEIG